jgi:hypothetical protein
MVAHTINLSIWKAEAGRTHILGCFGLCSKTTPCTPPRDKQLCMMEHVQVLGAALPYACGCVAVLHSWTFLGFCLCLTVWEGGSVWDLPLDTTAPGPSLEQLQQLEKAKAAKV